MGGRDIDVLLMPRPAKIHSREEPFPTAQSDNNAKQSHSRQERRSHIKERSTSNVQLATCNLQTSFEKANTR